MMKTDWGPLIGFYVIIAAITLGLGFISPSLPRIWLGANLVFLGFIIWMERPFIPVIRKNYYIAILASTLAIWAGLVVSCLR